MAKMLGISQSTYQRLESGNIKISLERLLKIAEVLEKPVESLSHGKTKSWFSKNNDKTEIERLQMVIIRQQKEIDELEKQLSKKRL